MLEKVHREPAGGVCTEKLWAQGCILLGAYLVANDAHFQAVWRTERGYVAAEMQQEDVCSSQGTAPAGSPIISSSESGAKDLAMQSSTYLH